MNEFSNDQIQAALNNPNDFPPQIISAMLLAHCFTLENLERHGLDKQQSARLRISLLAHEEDEAYQKCQAPNATYEDFQYFTQTYPNSTHYAEIKKKLDTLEIDKNKFDFLEQEVLGDTLDYAQKLNRIKEFEEKNPFSSFISKIPNLKTEIEEAERKRVEEAKAQAELEAKETAEREAAFERRKEDEKEWQRILSILSNPAYIDRTEEKVRLLDDYAQRYTLHVDEVPSKKKEIEADRKAMPRIHSILSDPESKVIDFLKLLQAYPQKKDSIKAFMLEDMKDHPNRYGREAMNWLLMGRFDDVYHIAPVFTEEEILQNRIVKREFLQHILTHPKDADDQDPLEGTLRPEINFKSHKNCTDVYFFGVPGSGKSTVLAGLFKVSKCGNLRFKTLPHGGHLGYTYANILTNYLENNLFPQRTKVKFIGGQELVSAIQDEDNPFDSQEETSNSGEQSSDKFIQIVDAELIEKDLKTNLIESHRLSIIEMPGERTLDFAVADVKNPEEMDGLLGQGTRQLFMNDNRKVFFIVIDPKPERTYQVKAEGGTSFITQRKALEDLVTFFADVPGLLEKVDAIHIILTKSDMLQNADDIDCIEKEVINKGYDGLIEDIQGLCDPSRGNINKQCNRAVHLFTFSLGKVYPGHMIEYQDYDAKKILQVIAANTYSTRTTPSKWDSIVDWMNK